MCVCRTEGKPEKHGFFISWHNFLGKDLWETGNLLPIFTQKAFLLNICLFCYRAEGFLVNKTWKSEKTLRFLEI